MAADEVTLEKATLARIQFLASTLDAFFQDFVEKAKSDDRLATIIAAARLAQMGQALREEFEANVQGLIDSPTEERVAVQACELVVTMVNKNADACRRMLGPEAEEPVPDTVPIPDRSLS